MKFAGCYHSEDAQYCERCGSPIANVFQAIDEYGEIHEFGSTCINIVCHEQAVRETEKSAESLKPTLPRLESHESNRKERNSRGRNIIFEYLKAVGDGHVKLAEALKAEILAQATEPPQEG